MQRLFRKGLCLAFGLSAMPAFAQELNFRAVASKPATSEISIAVGRPMPIDASNIPVFRGKANEDIIVPVSATRVDNVAFIQKDAPRANPLPSGIQSEFFPPPPQMIAAPADAPPVMSHSPGMIASPPIMSGPVVSGPVVSGPVVSGPISTSGCACSTSGFGLFDGFLGDDCEGSCGMSCSSCGVHDWHLIRRIHDWFHCGLCSGCCDPRPNFWLRGEYLLWNTSNQTLPPLVVQGPSAGGLNASSSLLYGNNSVPDAIQNGGRISMGFWFPRHNDWGLDGSYFFLGSRSNSFSNFSSGNPATGRPIQIVDNGLPGIPGAEIIAADPGAPGSINVDTTTKLWGFDANLRRKLCCSQGFWIDGVIGYRYLQLRDTIDIQENIGPFNPQFQTPPILQRAIVNDHFATQNTFNGAQVGLDAEWRFRPRLTLGGLVKVAAGNMQQTINIYGSTTDTFTGPAPAFIGTQTQRGGTLAQPSNSGAFSTNRFIILPEFGVRLGWDITPHWRFIAGYNLIYVSNVVRAADQIDLRVNRTQGAFFVPQTNGQPPQPGSTPVSPNLPAVPFRTTDYFAQGVSLGLEYRY
jgi:hypothetical protein